MNRKVFRDTASGWMHVGGAVAAIVGTVFLAITGSSGALIAAYIIFGVSMALLFSASGAYHLITRERVYKAFRKVDHAMIFVMIAGTYTPMILQVFSGSARVWYMAGIWAFALCGIILKLFFAGKFRILSTILYLLMGWVCVFSIKPIAATLGLGGILLLSAGGLFYTMGGVFYALKWPGRGKRFGFHEWFHILILLGAIAMYFMVYFYL